MRCLERNKRKIWLSSYETEVAEVDSEGLLTGEWVLERSEPVELFANVSATKGEATSEFFGVSLDYDRVVILDDTDLAVSETSVLWVDKDPEIQDGQATTSFDFRVVRVSKSLNTLAVAIKKADVS